MLSPGVDMLPKSASACKPSLWAGLGPAAGSEGGAAGVPSSRPNMRSSGGGANMSSSGGGPASQPQKLVNLTEQLMQHTLCAVAVFASSLFIACCAHWRYLSGVSLLFAKQHDLQQHPQLSIKAPTLLTTNAALSADSHKQPMK